MAGFLIYFVPNVSWEKIKSDAILFLNFTDVSGKSYYAKYDFKMHKDASDNVLAVKPGNLQRGGP